VKKLASVVNSNRARTISIVLCKLRKSPEQVLNLVAKLDPEGRPLAGTYCITASHPFFAGLNSLRAELQRPRPARPALQDDLPFQPRATSGGGSYMECHKVVLNRLDQVEAADGLLEVLDSACGELADTQHRLRQLLASWQPY